MARSYCPGFHVGTALDIFIPGNQCSCELRYFFLYLEWNSFGSGDIVFIFWVPFMDVFPIAFLCTWDCGLPVEYAGFCSLQRKGDTSEYASHQFIFPGSAFDFAGHGYHLALAGRKFLVYSRWHFRSCICHHRTSVCQFHLLSGCQSMAAKDLRAGSLMKWILICRIL